MKLHITIKVSVKAKGISSKSTDPLIITFTCELNIMKQSTAESMKNLACEHKIIFHISLFYVRVFCSLFPRRLTIN